jgi:hypothetical protein
MSNGRAGRQRRPGLRWWSPGQGVIEGAAEAGLVAAVAGTDSATGVEPGADVGLTRIGAAAVGLATERPAADRRPIRDELRVAMRGSAPIRSR